jgi:hypothetical protein
MFPKLVLFSNNKLNNNKMKNEIQAIKIGKTVNLSINGKLSKKVCDTEQMAKELYSLVLSAKLNPNDENVKKIKMFLNEKTRVALKCGLEHDPNTGEIFLAGFNTPIPNDLVDVIKEYHENNYPLDVIINFWKLLMINPDVRVRNSLFSFIKTHDFVLTDKGYMLVYKAVEKINDYVLTNFDSFVIEKFNFVKNEWKTSAKKYVIYWDNESQEFFVTKTVTADSWDLETKNVEIIGNLHNLYEELLKRQQNNNKEYPYQSKYSKNKMKIKLGERVCMDRRECDSNPATDCSYGLHVGSTKYVESFTNPNSDVVLICFVNPAHVVTVPDYDNSKMRVSEYFPFALANYDGRNIEIINQPYFENDYTHYEEQELNKMVEHIKSKEKPINTALNAENETRSFEELLKIIQNRIIIIKK